MFCHLVILAAPKSTATDAQSHTATDPTRFPTAVVIQIQTTTRKCSMHLNIPSSQRGSIVVKSKIPNTSGLSGGMFLRGLTYLRGNSSPDRRFSQRDPPGSCQTRVKGSRDIISIFITSIFTGRKGWMLFAFPLLFACTCMHACMNLYP